MLHFKSQLGRCRDTGGCRSYLGGCGCLGERRLGLPSQVWELRFLPSFPSFPRENRSSKGVCASPWKSQTRHPSSSYPRPSELYCRLSRFSGPLSPRQVSRLRGHKRQQSRILVNGHQDLVVQLEDLGLTVVDRPLFRKEFLKWETDFYPMLVLGGLALSL